MIKPLHPLNESKERREKIANCLARISKAIGREEPAIAIEACFAMMQGIGFIHGISPDKELQP